MSKIRYRVGIDAKENAKNIKERQVGPERGAGQWHSNYSTESEAVSALATQIRKNLKIFLVDHPEHGSGKKPHERLVSNQERSRIIRKALLLLAEEFQNDSTPPN